MFHKLMKMALWFITSVAAILSGSWVVGFNAQMYLMPSDATQFQQMLYLGLHGLFFFAGLMSLIFFFMSILGGCKKSGCGCM